MPRAAHNKEDDPAEDDDDDHGGGCTSIDTRDIDDAAAAFGRLYEKHVADTGEGQEQPTKASLALAEELGPVMREFNTLIVDTALGRKERFHTQALLKERQLQTGRVVAVMSRMVSKSEVLDG